MYGLPLLYPTIPWWRLSASAKARTPHTCIVTTRVVHNCIHSTNTCSVTTTPNGSIVFVTCGVSWTTEKQPIIYKLMAAACRTLHSIRVISYFMCHQCEGTRIDKVGHTTVPHAGPLGKNSLVSLPRWHHQNRHHKTNVKSLYQGRQSFHPWSSICRHKESQGSRSSWNTRV